MYIQLALKLEEYKTKLKTAQQFNDTKEIERLSKEIDRVEKLLNKILKIADDIEKKRKISRNLDNTKKHY